MDMDFARAMLTKSWREKESAAGPSQSREGYRKHVAEVILQNRTQILAFKAKPPVAMDGFLQEFCSDCPSIQQDKPAKHRRHIPRTGTMDALDLVNDYYASWTGGAAIKSVN